MPVCFSEKRLVHVTEKLRTLKPERPLSCTSASACLLSLAIPFTDRCPHETGDMPTHSLGLRSEYCAAGEERNPRPPARPASTTEQNPRKELDWLVGFTCPSAVHLRGGGKGFYGWFCCLAPKSVCGCV